MNTIFKLSQIIGRVTCISIGILALSSFSTTTLAWTSKDGTLTLHGFVDNTSHQRLGGNRTGLSKMRNRAQLEFSKQLDAFGPFSSVSLHGTLRATYDAVYDLNDDDYGDMAGGPVNLQSSGAAALTASSGIPFLSEAPWTPLPGPAPPPGVPATPFGAIPTPGTIPPLAATSPFLNGFFQNAATGGTNPNEGLRILGSDSFTDTGGNGSGLQFAHPVRPCDVDSRGCIADYLDADEEDLRFSEFNDRLDWLREIYIDATMPFANGTEINFRVGRQQIVWGRTDLFRVLDQVNPIDLSIQNIFEEFEDSRIPMGIFSAEYRLGATNTFDDLNFQFIWKFEKFRPAEIGQAGSPYSFLGAGNLLRTLATCWQVGCTVGNTLPNASTGLGNVGVVAPAQFPLGVPGAAFSTGFLASTVPAQTFGLRRVVLPDWEPEESDFGVRIEGVFRGVGFSVNALYFHSQNPSLRGGTAGAPSINPFLCDPALNPAVCGPLLGAAQAFNPNDGYLVKLARPFNNAFDIHFPRVMLFGASADFYIDPIKSAFRVEIAHTNGEEFANTLDPRLFSESNVVRWVVGWDRPTFIRFLNPNRTFNISGQVFGQHLLDHELIKTPLGSAGMPDWEDNYFITLLIQTGYFNDRLLPQIIGAYDVRAKAAAVAPFIDWLISDNWRMLAGINMKFGRSKNEFDNCGTCNIFPPFTDPLEGLGLPPTATGQTALRSSSINPLGFFRAGPLGNAQAEDEVFVQLRYRF